MKCTISTCRGKLGVSHTYTVDSEKFQRAICQKCGLVHALSTTAVPATTRGQGAKAKAAHAKKSCNDSF